MGRARALTFAATTLAFVMFACQGAAAEEAAMHRSNPRQTGYHDVAGPTEKPAVVWQHQLPGHAADLIVGSGQVLCAVQEPVEDEAGESHGELYALDAATGGVTWALTDLDAPATTPAILDGHVYVGTAAGTIYSVAAATGRIEGRLSFDGGVSSPCTVAGKTLYFGTDRGYVLSVGTDLQDPRQIRVTDRDMRWVREQCKLRSVPEPREGNVWAAPAVDGGTLYISSTGEHVKAIDLQSGNALWQQPIYYLLLLGFQVDARVTVTDARVVYMWDGDIMRCADRRTGQMLWDRGLWNTFFDFVVENGVIYLPSSRAGVWALNETDGSILWQVDFPVSGSLSADRKHIYFGTRRRHAQVYALDKATGEEKWHVDLDVKGGIVAAPVPIDGALFVTSRDGQVFRLE